MISILGKNKRFQEAMKVLQKMRNSGCQADNFTYASIFDGIGRATDMPKLEQYPVNLLYFLKFPFTHYIYELAIQFYKMMGRDGIVCDIVIFNTLINVSY
jgi:pentatricopeptide repeat protein